MRVAAQRWTRSARELVGKRQVLTAEPFLDRRNLQIEEKLSHIEEWCPYRMSAACICNFLAHLIDVMLI